MFNPLKEFLTPKYVVGLAVDSGFISAVRVYNALNSVEIDHAAFKEVEDPEDMVQELREFLDTENLVDDTLITCLPTSQAVVRQISVLFDNVKKLDKIIKYQMEPYVPHPIDEMIVDFLPPGPDGDVLTIGVPKTVLSEHLKGLSRADVFPKAVGLDDIALFSLYLNNHSGGSSQAVSIINLSKAKTVVQIISGKRLEFMRILPDGAENIEELMETFKIYHLKNPDVPLDEILLTGHLEDDGDMAETIGSHMKIRTSVWRPFDEIKHRLGDMETPLQARLSVPLGLAVSVANPPHKAFDLRKEEFVIASSVNPKRMSFFVFSLLLLLGFFTFNLYHNLHMQEQRHTELKRNTWQVYREAFPQSVNPIKGRELAQLSQKIEEGVGKYRWLEHITREGTVLDVLRLLTRSIVEFSDVKIDNISMEEKEIRLDGRASSFETVDKLEKKLASTGFFKTVKLVGAKIDKKDKAIKFNFAIEKNL